MKASYRALALLLFVGMVGPAFADDKVVRQFLPGTGNDSVGLVDQEEEETAGPQAIYSGDDGQVYMLDQVNNRVLKFDPNDPSQPPQALELPDNVQPTDLIVSKDTIYVWDGQARALQATGSREAPTRGLTMTRSIGDPDEATVSAFAQMGSMTPDPDASTAEGMTRSLGKQATQGRPRQTIASHGRGTVYADFKPIKDAGVEIALSSKDGSRSLPHIKLQVFSRLGAAELLDVDSNGRAYVFAENIPTDFTDAATAFVARYSPTGGLDGVYELPLNKDIALSRRFVTISPTGDVYFLRSTKGKVDVLGVGFRPLKGPVIDTAIHTAALGGFTLADLQRTKGARAAVRPLNRAQVIDTAYAFANIRWRVNAGAYGNDPDWACTGFNRVRRPGYLHGKLNQDVQGIPYCWGCMGSLPQIATQIERGMPAGNICTRNDPRPNLAGVDCSAFVSACWGLSTHFSTVAIPSIAKPVNPWDMLPGDAFNKAGSHVMLFLRFTPDKKVEVMESSTGGCNGKVCRNIYPMASLLARGYVPVRYRGLANDTSSPSAATIANASASPQGATARTNPTKPAAPEPAPVKKGRQRH